MAEVGEDVKDAALVDEGSVEGEGEVDYEEEGEEEKAAVFSAGLRWGGRKVGGEGGAGEEVERREEGG